MPTESTEFVTAFTERRASGALPSVTDQSNQSEVMRELFLTSINVGVVAIVEPNKFLRMKVCPIIKKEDSSLR